ncbi:MAG TPA: hypothetical protein VE991_00245, partial [Acidimicrobiales bacterium]|nr:hypothetical protein [Acidimicrobiales bacterium]
MIITFTESFGVGAGGHGEIDATCAGTPLVTLAGLSQSRSAWVVVVVGGEVVVVVRATVVVVGSGSVVVVPIGAVAGGADVEVTPRVRGGLVEQPASTKTVALTTRTRAARTRTT